MPAAEAQPQVTMQCLEVWGGNRASDNGVIMPGLDAWVVSRPYEDDDAGGDIHYVSSCVTGRITRILIADVSGHGQQVAKVAGSLRTLMRRFVNYVDQSRLVRGLNTEFASLTSLGSFATAIVATYWSPTDEMVITNAGHPRPLWYRARAGSWQFLDDQKSRRAEGLANIPLGIAEPTRYDEISITLERGDLVMLYTDSLIEARGTDGRQHGEAGLLAMISRLDPSDPKALIESLLQEISLQGGGPPKDDVTVLVLRPNEFKPRTSAAGGLKAGLIMARNFLGSLRPGGQPFPWPQLRADNIFGAFVAAANRVGKSASRNRAD